jgi:integrase
MAGDLPKGIRLLPSGNYQARVTVGGQAAEYSSPLLSDAKNWLDEQRVAAKKGQWRNPDLGKTRLRDWHVKWRAGRMVVKHTMKCDDSTWNRWIEPKWGDHTLGELERSRQDIKEWVRTLKDGGVGPSTILSAGIMLGKMLEEAKEAGYIAENPARKLDLPTPPMKPPFFWTHEEAAAIIGEIPEPYRDMIDWDMHAGPRFEELGGLLVDCVNPKLRMVQIVRVAVDGELREYPKSKKSYRSVPVPDHLIESFVEAARDRAPGDPLWPSPGGRFLNLQNFRDRVFTPAVERARTCSCRPFDVDAAVRLALAVWKCPVGRHHWKGAPQCDCRPADMAAFTEQAVAAWRCPVEKHKVRKGGPHDCRHTAASWLAMASVDIHRIQDLLGHERIETTRRYMHLDPSRHEEIRDVWGAGGLTGRPAVRVESP